jgi:LDH2 family malate/lactate/ureidoglycolate dehydrogenase
MENDKQGAEQIVTVPAADLAHFAARLLEAAGVPQADAELTGGILADANLRGIDTHGVSLLPLYLDQLRRGVVNARPHRAFAEKRSAVGTLDADHGLGHVATLEAMEQAVRMARVAGVATVLVHNSNHFGAAAHYALLAARHGCVGMVWSPAEPSVVPFGGRERFLGTNPIAIAAPAGTRYPGFTLDMATSVVAGGKVTQAGKNHQEIPAGWAIDGQGAPVTHPSDDDRVRKPTACCR